MHIHRFETVVSTNEIALDMARRGEPQGTTVLASSQSKGRGRRGRVWLDEPGACVLMSVIIRPELPPDRLPELSYLACVSVAENLKAAFGLEARIKLPNDVLVNGRKIVGTLIETTQTPGGTAAIVGIGLNVNQSIFPPEIAETATSLAIETGIEQDVAAAAESLASHFLANYAEYLANGFEEILTRWRKYV